MSHSEFILIKSIFIFSNNQSKRKKNELWHCDLASMFKIQENAL